MPSPGASGLADELAPITFAVGGKETSIIAGHDLIDRLADALDTGWTSASPTTVTNMAAAMAAEFSDFSGGYGLAIFTAIGTGIDTDVAAWAASFNAQTGLHTYAPTKAAIYSYAMAAMPINTPATQALASKAAEVFASNFEQEAG